VAAARNNRELGLETLLAAIDAARKMLAVPKKQTIVAREDAAD